MILLSNAMIVTSNRMEKGAVAIDGMYIENVYFIENGLISYENQTFISEEFYKEWQKQNPDGNVLNLNGKIVIAGGIDAHVHFREPGLIWKGNIFSESEAAICGGITSFIDMPNTIPPTVSIKELKEKHQIAENSALCNYSFHLAATNTNYNQLIEAIDNFPELFAGIKVFMGSSTGNMLVDNQETLDKIFQIHEKPILIHSEDEAEIRRNLENAKTAYGDNIPICRHEYIRSRKACIKSTISAIETAIKYGTKLHILHISTAEEVEMIRAAKLHNKNITAETSANYLWFNNTDYERLGSFLKCNPSIKTEKDREALIEGIKNGIIDTIGSDHAPHTLEEKHKPYLFCPSGIPGIKTSLCTILSIAKKYNIPLTSISSIMSEKASEIFKISRRGKIEKGMFADMVVIDIDKINTEAIVPYKCGYNPYSQEELYGNIEMVFINGEQVINEGKILSTFNGKGRRLDILA